MNQERTTMRLDQFDLNLLIAFDVLLRERNVTQAAAHLHITQSSMSAALKRLRVSLNDEILVQHGKKMIPAPRVGIGARDCRHHPKPA
jgi:DNA-binding transcriptional LysR family regulator